MLARSGAVTAPAPVGSKRAGSGSATLVNIVLNIHDADKYSYALGRYLLAVFRIRIRVDPDSNCQAGSVFGIRIRILKVKLNYKNPLFPQIFHDIHLF